MAGCSTKAKAIMVVLVGIFGLLCVGFAVSVTEKYRLQKERVHGLERKLSAGHEEGKKVPKYMKELEKTKEAKAELEDNIAEYTEAKEELEGEIAELQKELGTFETVKAAVGVQINDLESVIKKQQAEVNQKKESLQELSERLSALKEERDEIAQKCQLRVEDIRREQKKVEEQLAYFSKAKEEADKELEKKKHIINELKAELAKLKEEKAEPATAPDEGGVGETQLPKEGWDLSLTEELDKTFTLLRQRVSSPDMSLSEVSKLLSRAEQTLKSLE